MTFIRTAAAARGFPTATARTLARHMGASPPVRLLPLARRLRGFVPKSHGFEFPNSWKISDSDADKIRQHYGGERIDLAVSLVLNLVISSRPEIPGVAKDAFRKVVGAMQPTVRKAVVRLIQLAIGDDFAMCGGMAYSGLDFFYGAWDVRRFQFGKNKFGKNKQPPVGHPLRDYILSRHLDSLDANLAREIEWHLVLHLVPRVAEAAAIRALSTVFGLSLPAGVDLALLMPAPLSTPPAWKSAWGWVPDVSIPDIGDLIPDVGGVWREVTGKIGEWAGDLKDTVRDAVEDSVQAATKAIQVAGEAIKDTASAAYREVVLALRALAQKLLDALDIELGGPQEILARTRPEWPLLVSRLAEARPCPVLLVHDTLSIGDHHQVVAIGARDFGKGRRELDLWDNNDPDKTVTWILGFRGSVLEARRTDGAGDHRLWGFYVEGYEPRVPPADLR